MYRRRVRKDNTWWKATDKPPVNANIDPVVGGINTAFSRVEELMKDLWEEYYDEFVEAIDRAWAAAQALMRKLYDVDLDEKVEFYWDELNELSKYVRRLDTRLKYYLDYELENGNITESQARELKQYIKMLGDLVVQLRIANGKATAREIGKLLNDILGCLEGITNITGGYGW